MHDLSEDEDAKVEQHLPPKDIAIEPVITKTFNHYSIPLEISEGTDKKNIQSQAMENREFTIEDGRVQTNGDTTEVER